MNIELPIKNFPQQASVFSDPAKIKIVVKGRRFGLTKGAANDFIECALRRTFKAGLWVDTINSNINRYVDRYFIPKLKVLPKNMWHWSKQEKILHILDSYIDFRSIDRPENIEGFGYDKVFLNEAGIILKDEYLYYNAILPMFIDFNPQAVIGGTPKGKNIFYDLAMRGQSDRPENASYKYFHYTSYDNPYLTKDIIDELANTMPDLVRKQEIFAEFLLDTGVVFRSLEGVMTAVPRPPLSSHVYVIGCDVAKVQDFTVLTVYDRANNQQVYQNRFNQLEWPFVKQKIIETSKHYNNALVVLDATGVGDPIHDDLVRAGVPCDPVRFTNEIKKELIEKLSIWIELKKIRMINMPETVKEFLDFTYDVSGTGKIVYQAPEGMHDDIVISHALAVRALRDVYIERKVDETPLIRQDYRNTIKARSFNENEYEAI